MATHSENIEKLRTAVYGEEVRGAMIELFDEPSSFVDLDVRLNEITSDDDVASRIDTLIKSEGNYVGKAYALGDTFYWFIARRLPGTNKKTIIMLIDTGDENYSSIISVKYYTFKGSSARTFDVVTDITSKNSPIIKAECTLPAGSTSVTFDCAFNVSGATVNKFKPVAFTILTSVYGFNPTSITWDSTTRKATYTFPTSKSEDVYIETIRIRNI